MAVATGKIRRAWKAFLEEQGIEYGFAPKPKEPIYTLTFPLDLPSVLGYHVTVHIRRDVMYFEATIPLTGTDSDEVYALINRLNGKQPYGVFQYDQRDGELSWNQHLPISRWEPPENACLLKVIEQTREMVTRICLALTGQETEKEGASA